MKKAKTHYTNYRNQGVNPHDLSRSLHRQWFDVIQFPTSRELENMSSTGNEVAPVQSAKCHGCQETFPSHDECIKHIGDNSQCQVEIKHIGQTFCFVCERSYETVSCHLSEEINWCCFRRNKPKHTIAIQFTMGISFTGSIIVNTSTLSANANHLVAHHARPSPLAAVVVLVVASIASSRAWWRTRCWTFHLAVLT